MRLLQAVPALPVSDVAKSAAFYRDVVGFTLSYRLIFEGEVAVATRSPVLDAATFGR
jgi:catechol 2,3-dioxygenase-like lactoylglutathione lyase family enzyme